ncbi:AAA family ATPase [Rhodanobacter denitrificans]|uniref:AAA family ATPase n=1 Tax=Rhodanobacter denitrificans TaxID=666685 RepID=UPI001F2E0AD5|nr:AAA family ATPase [Rhodanobacter denitrificans]UJJ60440.1 AAA family ATPase [Rhodanobacter denitrificans]
MYNTALNTIMVSDAVLAKQQTEFPELYEANAIEKRRYKVATTDLGKLGLAAYAGNGVYVYTGTETHPHLAPLNPDYQFDNVDLDRMITVCLNREWERLPSAPRRGLLIMGPKGTGKSTYLEQRLARQGIPAARMSWGPNMTSADSVYSRTLVGGDIVVEPGSLWQAAEGGYPAIIEEIDLAQPAELAALNDLIDRGRYTIPETGEVIVAKRGFCVFATCNSMFMEDRAGGYAGTRQQNIAVLDRFFKFVMEHASEEKEAEFIAKLYPEMDADVVKGYAKFMAMIHKAADPMSGYADGKGLTHRLSLDFGRRNLIDWLDLTASFEYLEKPGFNVPLYALRPVYTAVLADAEQATVHALYDLVFGTAGSK